MTEMRKILALAVVIAMVCASLVIVSPNNTVIAEDSAKPLAVLNEGYPTQVVEDQVQDQSGTVLGLSDSLWGAQEFTPGVDGELTKISLWLTLPGGTGNVYWEIQDPSGGLPGPVISSTDSMDVNVANDGWGDYTFSVPATLSAGNQYALVLRCDPGAGIYWVYNEAAAYGGFAQKSTNSGASFNPITPASDFTFKTYMAVPMSMSKVAWHSDGSYALGIMSGTDHIYRYTRDTASWASEFDLAGGNVFRDIEYSEAEGNFYIVGDGAGQPMAWSYAGGPLNNLGAPAVAGATFFGLTIDGTGASTFLAVGYAGGAPYAAWFQEGGGWTPVATGWAGDHALYDVVWNTNPTVPFYYAVGEDAGTGDGIMYSFDTPGDTSATQYDVTGTGALRAIDWRPLTAFGLMGGDNTGGGNVFIFSHGGGPEMLLDTTDIIEDISFHPDDSLAMLVGYNGINQGVIYHFTPDNNDAITKMSTDGDYGKLYGVDVKAWTSPSSGLIVGASGAIGSFLSASDTGTTITVNAAFPHSFDIDMWKMSDGIGGSSKLNTQVDVEEIYTFMAEVNYTISGVDQFYADAEDDVRVELLAFYDELATPGVFPAADDQHRTRAFGAVWLEGAAPGGDSAGMMYPVGSPGTDEFLLDSFWLDASAPGDRYYIYMNVTFGPQTWAASGPFGGASTFLWDNVQSHNDANTWDFEMRIYDNNFVGATNSTFEEFGIFQYTNITVAGNPSGNAPPGSVGVQLGPNSQITCMANRDYYVNVSVPDLARVGGGSPILATNLAVNTTSAFATDVNSEILGAGVYFPGANMTLSVWGNTSQGPADWMVAAPLNSTTAHGPQGEDFQTLGPTEIEWWIDVPGGTAEGVYQATITFKIGYY